MAAVTVLTSGRIDLSRLERQLAREGLITTHREGGLRVSDNRESSLVDTNMAIMDGVSDEVFDQAVQLMGRSPELA